MCTDPSKNHHADLQRVQSFPKAVQDPHRFDLKVPKQSKSNLKIQELKQLPTVPPIDYYSKSPSPESSDRISETPERISDNPDWISEPVEPIKYIRKKSSYQQTHRIISENPISDISDNNRIIRNEIPPCVRNVILQQLQSPKPPENPKMIKKLSRTITLPEDPSDPTAFTIPYDQYLKCKNSQSRSRRSRQVIKIVGTFSFLMTMGIVITVLLCLCKYSSS